MSITRRLLAVTVLMVGLTASPTAQQEQPTEFDSWRVSGWTFVPGLTFGAVHDSNIRLASPPADTGRTDADDILVAAPFGQLEYFSRRTEFTSAYRGYLRRYRDIEELNGFDHLLELSVRRLATRRVTLSLQNSFRDVPTTDEVEVNGVLFAQSGARRNTLAAGLEARVTRYTNLTIRYDNTWVDFDRKENFLTGGVLNGVGAELARRLSDRTSVGAEYGVRFADLNEGTRELTFHDVGGTLRHALGPHTSFSAGAGMSRMDDKLTGETRTGPYVRSSITHSGERSTVGASFGRQFLPSFGFGGSSASQEIRGFVRMPITSNRTYVRGSVAWRRSDPFIETVLKLDTILIRTTVGYAVARWFRTEGFYTYTRQDSEVTGGEIDRHRVGVQFVVSQPMRIR